ncbi:MAG: HyaD/HybD family hydrogenase maturation endopeptidase [Desulfobacteraceae bacterium]|nr:HyaD/HybD family hydrogenase maturation endopeptidase [Desulfobacteraceae bacterium]
MDCQAGIGPKVLVLGIGNLVMSDDGVGVKVVHKIRQEYRFAESVGILDGGTLGLDLLPKLEGVERLIVVDAVETGQRAGTCVRLPGEELPIALQTKLSPHQMGLKDLLSVAELMGHVPREMVLIGVQPASIEMDTELTGTVQAKVDELVRMVLDELAAWDIRPI